MDLTRFSPCCCSCRCDGCGVQPCGHAAEVRRSARVSPRTDSVTGGYRHLTHPRLVTAHAHDVLLVPVWLTDCVCSCPVGRLRDYLQERRAVCDCDTGLTEAYRGHVRGRRVVSHEYITCLGYIAPSLPHTCPETPPSGRVICSPLHYQLESRGRAGSLSPARVPHTSPRVLGARRLADVRRIRRARRASPPTAHRTPTPPLRPPCPRLASWHLRT